MGKATLQKAALGRTMAGIIARERADLNTGCVSPLRKSPLCSDIPSVLLSPSRGWDTEKICCCFPCRTVGRKFCRAGNFATAHGDTPEGAGRREGCPSPGLFGSEEEGAYRRPSRLPRMRAVVPQAAVSCLQKTARSAGATGLSQQTKAHRALPGCDLNHNGLSAACEHRESGGRCSALLCTPLVSPSCQDLFLSLVSSLSADCLQHQERAHHLGLLAAGLGGSHMPFASLGLKDLFWKLPSALFLAPFLPPQSSQVAVKYHTHSALAVPQGAHGVQC